MLDRVLNTPLKFWMQAWNAKKRDSNMMAFKVFNWKEVTVWKLSSYFRIKKYNRFRYVKWILVDFSSRGEDSSTNMGSMSCKNRRPGIVYELQIQFARIKGFSLILSSCFLFFKTDCFCLLSIIDSLGISNKGNHKKCKWEYFCADILKETVWKCDTETVKETNKALSTGFKKCL